MKKPLGKKTYGHIPHLIGSKTGPKDRHVPVGQHIIATEGRDPSFLVIAQEKLDGACVGVSKLNGELLALGKAGYLARDSERYHIRLFHYWVEANKARFDLAIDEGETLVGEWLALAHGTKYSLLHEPFLPFDILRDDGRASNLEMCDRIYNKGLFTSPKTLHVGLGLSIEEALELLGGRGHHGAEQTEGVVYRVEKAGRTLFIAKFVKSDYEPGKYLPEVTQRGFVWNYDITALAHEESKDLRM